MSMNATETLAATSSALIIVPESADVFSVQTKGLDPITVFLQDKQSRGRITIECYGDAWSTWFGSIGTNTLRNFICGIDADYLANRLVSSVERRKKLNRTDYGYLQRISAAVIRAIKSQEGKLCS